MLLATTHRSLRIALSSRPYSSLFIQDSFAKNALHVLDVGRRFLKFSAIGLFLLGTTAATAYEAVHQYVEHVELSPGVDPDVQKWEWQNPDCCNWTSDPRRGGTDPFIGFRARHIVRAAWMASNWGVGYSTAVVDSGTKHNEGLAGPGGIKVIDAGLQRMEDFLRSAIRIAEEKRVSGSLNPRTFRDLLLCHASVLERLGESFCADSKAEYERAWSLFPPHGSDAAHVAWKLGNLNLRLGQADDALVWWSRAILLSCGKSSGSEKQIPVLPDVPPSSPQAQRTLTSTLVSLSAFYATSGQLKKAQEVEEAALNLIRSITPPDSLASATPAQALHALYLLHRSSLLSIHLAEVLHARKQPPIVSLQWLSAAAESSERVANALTGLPIDNFRNRLQVNDKPLLDMFKSSRPMHKTATSLFRDATRSAAEAWNLMGVLHEAQGGPGSTSEKALECYQRAVEWASTSSPQPDAKRASDGIPEADWNLIWSNYNRLQQHAKQNKPT